MGFLDRLHGIATGAAGALQAPLGLVKDLATAPFDDEINGGIFGVMYRRSVHRLGQVGENLMGPEEGLGSAVGALPEFVRDPGRVVTKSLLDGAEWAYREGISEPLTTAVTAASLADAGHGFDLSKGYEIAQSRSPGQAIALAFTTQNILDDVEVEKAIGTDAYEIISGTSDAIFRMMADPTIIGGKAAKLTRGHVLQRPATIKFLTPRPWAPKGERLTTKYTTGAIRNGKDARRVAQGKGAQKFVQYVDDLARDYGVVDDPARRRSVFDDRNLSEEEILSTAREATGAATLLDEGFDVDKIYNSPEKGWTVSARRGDVVEFHRFASEADARNFGELARRAPEESGVARRLGIPDDVEQVSRAKWMEDWIWSPAQQIPLVRQISQALLEGDDLSRLPRWEQGRVAVTAEIMDEVAAATPTQTPLYRGIGSKEGITDDLVAQLETPGGELTLPLSSWSQSEQFATGYAIRESGQRGTRYILEVKGARAVDTNDLARGEIPAHLVESSQKELLTYGRFRVANVAEEAQGVRRVTLEQVDVPAMGTKPSAAKAIERAGDAVTVTSARDALAVRIRDQFFPDHMHGGIISEVIADAATTGDTHFAIRTVLGDPEAAAQLAQRRGDVASKMKRIEDTADDVGEYGVGTLFHRPGNVALINAEKAAMLPQEVMLRRLDHAFRRAQEAPRVSKTGELRQAMKAQTWLYRDGPLSTMVHKVFDMRPIRLVSLNMPDGDVQLARSMRTMPLSEAEATGYRSQYMRARNATERKRILEEVEDLSLERLTDGLDPKQKQAMIDRAHQGRIQSNETVNSKRFDAGKGKSKIEFEGEDGQITERYLPLYLTQNDPAHVLADWNMLKKFREQEIDPRIKRFQSTRKGARKVAIQLPEAALDQFYRVWKPGVLLRAGWPIRVGGDEQLRILAKIGAMSQAEELWGGLKQSLTNKLNRVPREQRPAYFAGEVKTNRNYPMERSMGTPGEMNTLNYKGERITTDMEDLIDARVSLGRSWGAQEQDIVETLRTGQWKTSKPGDPTYFDDWQKAVNVEIGQDMMARQFLQGKNLDEVVNWMRGTAEGRDYMSILPQRSDAFEWAQKARDQLEDYLPTQNLRDLALEGRATADDLIREVRHQEWPFVNGEVLKEGLKGSIVDQTVGRFVKTAQDKLGRAPTNRLARSKYFDHEYRMEASRLANMADEIAIAEGRLLTADELHKISQQAREYGLSQTNKLLYNLAEQSELAHLLRHVSPFFMASQEVASRWVGLAIENPDFAARMRQVWMAPEKAGMVVDENGLEITWDGSNEQAGENRYVVVTAPDYIKDIPVLGEAAGRPVAFNKKSFNTILQGFPGLGPPAQIAMNAVIADRPDLEDAMKFVLPFGANQDVMDQIIPTGIKRAFAANQQDENQNFMRMKMRVFQDMQVDFALNKRDEEPTWAEANKRTQDLFKLRVAAAYLLPAHPTFKSPYQMYIDAYRQRMDVDPEGADDWFYETFGPEFFPLITSMTKSMDGVAPTREGYAAREKYQDLIERNPELGGLIIGDEGAGEFSYSVYQMQQESRLSPESDDPQRRGLTMEESGVQPFVRLGWIEYGKMMDLLDAERMQRGLASFSVKEAQDLALMKRMGTEALKQKYPAWDEEFSIRDENKWKKRITGMTEIANSEELQDRDEIQMLKVYLEARQFMQRQLAERDAEGGAKTLTSQSNFDLQLMWNAITAKLTDNSPAFASTYYRYLEHDPVVT